MPSNLNALRKLTCCTTTTTRDYPEHMKIIGKAPEKILPRNFENNSVIPIKLPTSIKLFFQNSVFLFKPLINTLFNECMEFFIELMMGKFQRTMFNSFRIENIPFGFKVFNSFS